MGRFFEIHWDDETKVEMYYRPMNLRKKAAETFDSVTEASEKVVDTTEWATVALIGVAALSLLGLAIGVVALGRATTPPARES